MTNTLNEKATIANAVFKLVPPQIRNTLLKDQSFREEYGFKAKVTIAFASGSNSVSVERSVLFNAIRIVLAGETPVEVIDAKHRTWNLTNDARKGEPPNLILSSNQERLVILPDFFVLSGDASIRIHSLEKSASDVNLPVSDQEKWRGILEQRALKDDEADTFYADICDTPIHVERRIRAAITTGISADSFFIPFSRRYFERLVGAYEGSGSIRDYATNTGRKFFEQLMAWQPYEGFLFSLLLSSHSALTSEIITDILNQEDLEKAYDYLEQQGDMLSRLGAFEVGLRILPARPEIEPFLLRIVQRIRDDDVEGIASEFKLFSALFVLVDGELARTHLFADTPPFYRRLASLAQAGLIYRQLVQGGIDYNQFFEWAISKRSEFFYMQSLTDLRTEPRWNPELVMANELQAYVIGRIIIASNKFRANLGDGELHDTILGDGKWSLVKLFEFPRPYFPGPLEGAEDSPNILPEDYARFIEAKLETDKAEAASFLALVNYATIFKMSSNHAELAAKALKLGNYTLSRLKDKTQLLEILYGLATVAAVSRNLALADELRILVRRYRRDPQYAISVEEAMEISLVASAARTDLIAWREYAGACLTELAWGELEGDEGEVLYSRLSTLLHSVPELWVSCARADAALQAWCNR